MTAQALEFAILQLLDAHVKKDTQVPIVRFELVPLVFRGLAILQVMMLLMTLRLSVQTWASVLEQSGCVSVKLDMLVLPVSSWVALEVNQLRSAQVMEVV